jgi:hypothetical protein
MQARELWPLFSVASSILSSHTRKESTCFEEIKLEAVRGKILNTTKLSP